MNELIGIKHDTDIARFKNELYSDNTPLQLEMALFESKGKGEGPSLNSMKINWKNIRGPWNEALFLKFVVHCKEEGYGGDEELTEADEDEIRRIFFDRITRLVTVINAGRPRQNETSKETQLRVAAKNSNLRERSRQNTRRLEVRVLIIAGNEQTAHSGIVAFQVKI